MEYWNEPKVSDLAPEHENLTELVAGLLLAGSSVITASALDGDCEKAGTSGVLAAATAQTLPMYIFSMIRAGSTPVVNALSTVMLLISSIFVLGFSLIQIRRMGMRGVRL